MSALYVSKHSWMWSMNVDLHNRCPAQMPAILHRWRCTNKQVSGHIPHVIVKHGQTGIHKHLICAVVLSICMEIPIDKRKYVKKKTSSSNKIVNWCVYMCMHVHVHVCVSVINLSNFYHPSGREKQQKNNNNNIRLCVLIVYPIHVCVCYELTWRVVFHFCVVVVSV